MALVKQMIRRGDIYFVDLDNDPTLTRQASQEAARFKQIIAANVTDLERDRKSAPEIGG